MSNGNPVPNLTVVDAFTRALYRRAKTSGPDFADVSTVVRRLHTVLKHLRVESGDPDSLLNSDASSVYARQLAPLVEDCDFALKQLETILEKYGEATRLEERELDMVAMIRTKLANQKTNIDMFLDTVQLHNPSKAQRIVDEQGGNLDDIKDKVDAIAARLFARRDSGVGEDDEDLWQQFRTELEKEGFSKDVLRKNKEVLRAYIRELEESTGNDATAPTSVRGLLAQERSHSHPAMAVTPASLPHRDGLDPGETYGSYDVRYAPVAAARGQRSAPAMPNQYSTLSMYERENDTEDEHNDSLALISTRDLMAMDTVNNGMENLRLSAAAQNYSTSPSSASPSTRYLPPDVAAARAAADFSPSSPNNNSNNNTKNFGVSPRFVPPMPSHVGGGGGPPPSAYGASPRISQPRIAPDRYGMGIPMEAKWTRIRRALVSPEILERAGVRYEARPDYVAVLGVLTREEITNYARLSAEARAARSSRRRNGSAGGVEGGDGLGAGGSNAAATSHPSPNRRGDSPASSSDDPLWDSSDNSSDGSYPDDDRKGNKTYHIVPPPSSDREKGTSPAATVQPKPILKNKNENHVRFDPEPHELDPNAPPPSSSPRSYRDDRDQRRRRPARREHRDRDRDRDRDRGSRDRDGHHRDRERERERDRDRDRDRDRERDRDRDRDRDGFRDRDRERDRDRDRDRHRDRDHYPGRHHRERSDRDRRDKKKAWGETLGAVGIGGAAASLLSVLTEAASVL